MNKVLRGMLLLPLLIGLAAGPGGSEEKCTPSEPDALGPFYKPGAPKRDRVGQGYVLTGVVKSSETCRPIAGAQLEFWLAGPDGNYDEAHRAAVFTDAAGAYRFESNFPPRYSSRPPHIHMRVTAPGFQPLVVQHYPKEGTAQGEFEVVLKPAR
jgi:protocatechuate 3,4-dioxygenase beta subunit